VNTGSIRVFSNPKEGVTTKTPRNPTPKGGEGGHIWVKALLSVSDQAAISVIDKLGSKGGPRYLTWNLQEEHFKDVASEAIELTDVKNVDVDPNRG